VVDRYEHAPGVINEDVLEFSPSKRYDLIVSISTLEHIGHDEDVREPDKPARTVSHLRTLLRPGGKLLITFPLGHNPQLDHDVATGALELDEVHYMKRVSRSNHWLEVPAAEIAGARYGAPYPKGNGIVMTTGHTDVSASR
jgi:SAM-dependent methyltransferase